MLYPYPYTPPGATGGMVGQGFFLDEPFHLSGNIHGTLENIFFASWSCQNSFSEHFQKCVVVCVFSILP